MDAIKNESISRLRQAREDLLKMTNQQLNYATFNNWFHKWKTSFELAETVTSHLIIVNIGEYSKGFQVVSNSQAFLNLRDRIVGLIDGAMKDIDSSQQVLPVLDSLILSVQNPKLAQLLKEFNEARNIAPNLSAIGFRTILALIMIEMAKIKEPKSDLANRKDIKFEREIQSAIGLKIFDEGTTKILGRYLGGSKDSYDNIAHKVEENNLIVKEDIEEAVKILNKLLPLILGRPTDSQSSTVSTSAAQLP